jgi:hypothetical protein
MLIPLVVMVFVRRLSGWGMIFSVVLFVLAVLGEGRQAEK